MDLTKYDLVPEEFATAREIGLAAATLGAMARRGLVEVLDSTPKKYRKTRKNTAKIYQFCEINKDDYDTYSTPHKKDQKLGILCSISDGTIVDY